MKQCGGCGRFVPNGWKICQYCGETIETAPVSPEKENTKPVRPVTDEVIPLREAEQPVVKEVIPEKPVAVPESQNKVAYDRVIDEPDEPIVDVRREGRTVPVSDSYEKTQPVRQAPVSSGNGGGNVPPRKPVSTNNSTGGDKQNKGLIIAVIAGAAVIVILLIVILIVKLRVIDDGPEETTPPTETAEETVAADDENSELMEKIESKCEELDDSRNSGSYDQVSSGDITGWMDGDEGVIVHQNNSSGYEKTWYCDDGELIYAEYEGDDIFHFYLEDGEVVCFEYWDDSSADESTVYTSSENTDKVTGDYEDAVAQLADEPETAVSSSPSPSPSPSPETTQTSHSYDIVMSNCTWWEAKTAAEKAGGHLAVITTQDEFDEVSSLATAKQNALGQEKSLYLWIGASRSESSDVTTYKWVTGGTVDLNSGFWYGSEPSYFDLMDTAGGQINECYVCLWRAKLNDVDIGWTMNDQRNDLLSASDSFSGRIGYIVEYGD